MSTVAFIRRCIAAGMDMDTALVAAEAFEASAPVFVPSQSKGAQRTAKWRAKKASPSVTVTNSDVCDKQASPVTEPSRAQVVTPSLPSLRSEELKPPVSPNGLTAPKGSETARGTRLPEDWRPIADYVASDFGLSHEQHADELAKFLDYWRSVPGAKGRKSDWPATWRNWMRRASENSARKAPHERPHPDPKFDARQANLARALAGADSAAGRTWKP